MHLVGFIVRIYRASRSPERQRQIVLVGVILGGGN